jgi:hypothetical protein
MYGIDLGVTPPGTIRKMNQDNIVCSTLTNMNELKYVYVCYDYDYEHVWTQVRLCKRIIALDALR